MAGSPVSVNGRGVTVAQISAEMQYHPAKSRAEAEERATRSLVIRELLLQEAEKKGFFKDRCSVSDEQAMIEALLKEEITVPEPDLSSCERYYKNNRQRFVTSPLFQVSHILLPAGEGQKAEDILSLLRRDPSRFSDLAKEHSRCPSAKDGGRLGQIARGQTTPEFEAALFKMKKGEISGEPVATRYGYHIIQVHERADAREMSFDAAKDWIADYLRRQSWQRAVSQYISILAGKSDIKGFVLKAADTPLVQ